MKSLRVTTFYRFAALHDFAECRAGLAKLCCGLGVKGTILLAPEGVNGTIAGQDEAVSKVIAALEMIPGCGGLRLRNSTAAAVPFRRMKVRLKKEIVTMGIADLDPAALTGRLVEPAHWNALIADPATLVIDARNHFEIEHGTFAGAIDPDTKSFGEFPAFVQRCLMDQKNRPIAMFCTGGIRCEKASSYLLQEGFTEVHQLHGGILNYLDAVPESESLWRGACFVFDERETLGHGLIEV